MGTQTPNEQFPPEPHIPHWKPASRVTFRFCFVYFGLLCLTTQIFGGLFPIPKVDIPDPSTLWPLRQITSRAAVHIFRVTHALVYTGSGSGDKTSDWVLVFCLLVFSVLATGVWSVLDRKRENHITFYKWFRLFLRFALASEMILYGMAKVIPAQMPFPYLTTLIAPFGTFLPMKVLWSSIGASPAYEIFAGCAELLAGILLIVPRTTMLGAMVCLADLTQVFILNMTYDVPVKLFSFHLLLMALFLLAPELRRLADFFLWNFPVGPSTQPPLFRTRRANRIALTVQIIFGIWLVGVNAYSDWGFWQTNGPGHAKSLLYGIWNVDQISVDGQLRAPLPTDNDRWRRAIFDSPAAMAFERMDESFAYYAASIDANAKTLALTSRSGKKSKADFIFQRVAPDRLTLDGSMDGHKIHMELQLVDLKNFLHLKPRFHWIQEYPYTP